MSYTTVDEVALFLNREVADLTALETSQLGTTISYMDGVINNYCGWNLLATDYTDKRFDGSGTNTLDLRLSPVNTITEVKVRAADGTFTEVTTGIEILEDGLIQFLPWAVTDVTTFTTGVKNWFITFNAGFEDGEVPYELRYAATFLTAIHFNKIIDENMGAEEEKFEGVTFKNITLEMPSSVKRTLDRYRLVSIF